MKRESPKQSREVTQLGVKKIFRDNSTTIEQTTDAIAKYFRWEGVYHE